MIPAASRVSVVFACLQHFQLSFLSVGGVVLRLMELFACGETNLPQRWYKNMRCRLCSVENISNNSLQVRIQEGKKVLGIIDVDPDETKEFVLEKNYVLYMDTDRPSAGKVSFKEFEYSK